jgi:hypothetical protein
MVRILKEETVYTIYMVIIVPLAKIIHARQINITVSEVKINTVCSQAFAYAQREF